MATASLELVTAKNGDKKLKGRMTEKKEINITFLKGSAYVHLSDLKEATKDGKFLKTKVKQVSLNMDDIHLLKGYMLGIETRVDEILKTLENEQQLLASAQQPQQQQQHVPPPPPPYQQQQLPPPPPYQQQQQQLVPYQQQPVASAQQHDSWPQQQFVPYSQQPQTTSAQQRDILPQQQQQQLAPYVNPYYQQRIPQRDPQLNDWSEDISDLLQY